MIMAKRARIGVVIPAYKVTRHILGIIDHIGEDVEKIYVVDDGCPEKSGAYIKKNCRDNRVIIIYNETNTGVGGATVSGYLAAIRDQMNIVVKIDGDGQMDPLLIPNFVAPILEAKADYTKGNRFQSMDSLRTMPKTRFLGNSVLSFFTKASSGYWTIFDPTNGYTAIDVSLLQRLPLKKLNKRYFFESDMLFRLYLQRAVVMDIPMDAVYRSEESGINIPTVILPFLKGHAKNLFKRILYAYFLSDFSIASLEIVFGLALFLFGFSFGAQKWLYSLFSGQPSTSGTVMLAALPLILGFQLLLSALNYDIQHVPSVPRR